MKEKNFLSQKNLETELLKKLRNKKTFANVKNLVNLIDKYIRLQDVNKTSRVTYRNDLKQFFKWLKSQESFSMTRETILDYKESLDLRGFKSSTKSRYLVAVRKFFEWTDGLEIFPNIAKGIKGARRNLRFHQKSALDIAQIKRLLGSMDTTKIQGKRDFALINLLLRTGIRLIEAARADFQDIDREGDDAILWVRGKGRDGKDECVVLEEKTLNPIIEYVQARGIKSKKEPIFTSLGRRNPGGRLTTFTLSKLIKKYLRISGINNKRITAHSLRHTFGILSVKAGVSLYEVQLAMRHKSPSTTEIYLGDVERLKRIKGAPEKKVGILLNEGGIDI